MEKDGFTLICEVICLAISIIAAYVCFAHFGIGVIVAIAMVVSLAYASEYDSYAGEDEKQVNIFDCLLPVLGFGDIYAWSGSFAWGYAFMLVYYICRCTAIFALPTFITIAGTSLIFAFVGICEMQAGLQ